jgi:hypothetical protein
MVHRSAHAAELCEIRVDGSIGIICHRRSVAVGAAIAAIAAIAATVDGGGCCRRRCRCRNTVPTTALGTAG